MARRNHKGMTVLIAEFGGSKSKMLPYLREHGWGRMWSKMHPQWECEDEPWGVDNGAWSCHVNGTEFNGTKFLHRLRVAEERQQHPPCVVACPDIVEGGLASLAFSIEWRNKLEHTWGSLPWYLCVQDGMCIERVRRELLRGDFYDGVFLGGSDEFKSTAFVWCDFAHTHGKLFHFARCNREDWLRLAINIGADSIDSARPLRTLTSNEIGHFKRFEQLVTGQCPQTNLGFMPSTK